MAIPRALTRFNKAVGNKVLIHLAGHGPFVELEHIGRRSGKPYRIPLNAFRHGDTVTLALTYGPKVDWYRNVVAAGGCRIRMGRRWLALGAPQPLTPATGMARMPALAKPILRLAGVTDFVELPVVAEAPIE